MHNFERQKRKTKEKSVVVLGEFYCYFDVHTTYYSAKIYTGEMMRGLCVFFKRFAPACSLFSLSFSLSLSLARVSYIEEAFWPSAAPFTLSLAPFVVASFPDRKRLANIFFNPLGVFGLFFVFKCS